MVLLLLLRPIPHLPFLPFLGIGLALAAPLCSSPQLSWELLLRQVLALHEPESPAWDAVREPHSVQQDTGLLEQHKLMLQGRFCFVFSLFDFFFLSPSGAYFITAILKLLY